jgi:hypothetical protein
MSERKSVVFASQDQIHYLAPQTPRRRPTSSQIMERKLYEGFSSDQVTDEMLEEASVLFSRNYGVWGAKAPEKMGKFAGLGTMERILGLINILTTYQAPVFCLAKLNFDKNS